MLADDSTTDGVLVTAAEMRGIDAHCGIPGTALMEAAGNAVARAAIALATGAGARAAESPRRRGPFLILAGRGNNGGDGYAAAIALKAHGESATVLALAPISSLSGDAAHFASKAREAGISIEERTDAAQIERDLPGRVAGAAVIVDAILGTGTRPGTADPVLAATVEALARRPQGRDAALILAVDLPSGVLADTGQCLRTAAGGACAVAADATVTLGRPKPGLYLYPGAAYAGRVSVDAIGIPGDAYGAAKGRRWNDALAAAILPRRDPLAHKGHARVLVIGGSAGLRGAAILAATAALRSGAGYVYLSQPATALDPQEPVEAVRRPLPGTPEGRFAPTAASAASALAEDAHAIVLGCGLGRGAAEQRLAEVCTRSLHTPVVVDADALAQIAPDSASMAAGPRVLTPHAGEFSKLFGGTVDANEEDRVGRALRAAAICGQTVLFKGRPTITASPDGRYTVNATGNELLATCGSGDVLAGIIGSLLAQGLPPFEAASAGAYLHGKTVEEWPYAVGMTAGDVARAIPSAWTRILAAAGLWPRTTRKE